MGTSTSSEIRVDQMAEWVQNVDDKFLFSKDVMRIYAFFLVRCPWGNASSMKVNIESYGWVNPWGGKKVLAKKLQSVVRNESFYSFGNSAEGLGSVLIDKGLSETFPPQDLSREIAYVVRYKRNIWMSIFRHIRNSLAHSRYSVSKTNKGYVFAFEDVDMTETDAIVTARMVIKKSTLIKWIDIIENGPT